MLQINPKVELLIPVRCPIQQRSMVQPLRTTRDRHYGKKTHVERQEDNDTTTIQSLPLPRDAFRLRQMQKARAGVMEQRHMEVASPWSILLAPPDTLVCYNPVFFFLFFCYFAY